MGETSDPRIERVARALAISHGTDPDQDGPGQRHVIEVDGVPTIMTDHFGPLWKVWIRDAEAVISALDDKGTTHAEGCYLWGPKHYACALARIAAGTKEGS